MNKHLLLAITLLTSGCSATLENRVSCTLDRKVAVYSSFYGPVAISSRIADGDAAALCANRTATL